MTEIPRRPPIARRHCRHYGYDLSFNGGPTCARGVDQKALTCIPCYPDPKALCSQREEWTDEERATFKAWMDERLKRTVLVMQAVPPDGREGDFRCPACNTGTVSWARMRNKHIHAICSTPDCFAIIQ